MTDPFPHVVFLHGLFGCPDDFRATANLLPARFPVMAPTLPLGSGERETESVDGLAAYLGRLLDAAGVRRAVLTGNSLGGHVALRFTSLFPGRVAGLVLSGSSGLFERSFTAGVPSRPTREWIRTRIAEVFHDEGFVSEGRVESILHLLADRRRTLSLVRVARDAKQDNLRGSLSEIRVPALLLWGANDRITPPDVAREFRTLLQASRLLFVDKAGHAPMLERPTVFAFHLAAFLNDLFPEAPAASEEEDREAA